METDKLDTLLLLMSEQEEHQIVTPDMAESFIPKTEYTNYTRQLISDKLAILLDKNSGFLMLTSKGAEFIKTGGYTKNKERSETMREKKRKLGWVLAFVSTGLLLCFLILKLYTLFQNA